MFLRHCIDETTLQMMEQMLAKPLKMLLGNNECGTKNGFTKDFKMKSLVKSDTITKNSYIFS